VTRRISFASQRVKQTTLNLTWFSANLSYNLSVSRTLPRGSSTILGVAGTCFLVPRRLDSVKLLIVQWSLYVVIISPDVRRFKGAAVKSNHQPNKPGVTIHRIMARHCHALAVEHEAAVRPLHHGSWILELLRYDALVPCTLLNFYLLIKSHLSIYLDSPHPQPHSPHPQPLCNST
jgi:hypothetical protein